ncbi:MAG: radical SAM protein [Planctomycetes bacterium]|nr:radical SAM protein [Planctomycetota bacterium]
MSIQLNLHAFEPASRANGPGRRCVVWFQGCTLRCPGCFNPETHAVDSVESTETSVIAERIVTELQAGHVLLDGVTFSGGEPLQQPYAFLDLLERLSGSGLSTLCFSGYTLDEIGAQELGPQILAHLDVLIAGRYVASRRVGRALLGSENQQLHLLTDRYRAEDFERVPGREVILHADGSVTISGVDPWSPV